MGCGRFGTAHALYRIVMQQLIETRESKLAPTRTRSEARELLEGLRTVYQSLSVADRTLVQSMVRQMERAQAMQELQ